MIKRILLVIFLVVFSSFSVHKFYVSVTQVVYNEATKTIELSSRIFIDDLEKALQKKHQTKLYLDTPKQHPEAKEFITKYFQDNFLVTINGKPQQMVLKSVTFENDVLIPVFTTKTIKSIKKISFKNTLLFDTYTEQQNIVHIEIKKVKKSFLSKIDDYYFEF